MWWVRVDVVAGEAGRAVRRGVVDMLVVRGEVEVEVEVVCGVEGLEVGFWVLGCWLLVAGWGVWK